MPSYQSNPLVSVCIPTYNSARYLRKSLGSIVKQTYDNIEIIVSDNASTDNTKEIVKLFTDNRVKYRRNSTNIGCYNNYNECLKVARGKFVAFYHSDDVYELDIVERELEFLQNHTGVAAVFALDRLINENDRLISRINLPKELKNRNVYNFSEIYKALLKNGNSFLRTPTFMARISIYNNIGLFNEKDFGTSADLEIWLRILEKYPIGILDQTLMKHRISRSSGTASYWNERTERADFFLVMDHFSKSQAITMSIEEKLWKRYGYHKGLDNVFLARNLLKKGETNKAKNLLNKALSMNFIANSFEGLNGIKQLIIGIVLTFGTNVGFGKLFGNILKTIKK